MPSKGPSSPMMPKTYLTLSIEELLAEVTKPGFVYKTRVAIRVKLKAEHNGSHITKEYRKSAMQRVRPSRARVILKPCSTSRSLLLSTRCWVTARYATTYGAATDEIMVSNPGPGAHAGSGRATNKDARLPANLNRLKWIPATANWLSSSIAPKAPKTVAEFSQVRPGWQL